MSSVQSATKQQEHIGSFKRRLCKRREGTGDILVLLDLVLLQKEYEKQFFFEKRVGSGGTFELCETNFG